MPCWTNASVKQLWLISIWQVVRGQQPASQIVCWGWKVLYSSEKPSVVPFYLRIFNSFSFAHSNNIKSNTVTHIGIIISVGSLRNEEKSIFQDLLEDCNTFRKFWLDYRFTFTRIALLGTHAVWLSCPLKARNCPVFLYPLCLETKYHSLFICTKLGYDKDLWLLPMPEPKSGYKKSLLTKRLQNNIYCYFCFHFPLASCTLHSRVCC